MNLNNNIPKKESKHKKSSDSNITGCVLLLYCFFTSVIILRI